MYSGAVYRNVFAFCSWNTKLLLLIASWIVISLFSFNKILLFFNKKLAFEGFYSLLVVLKKNRVSHYISPDVIKLNPSI